MAINAGDRVQVNFNQSQCSLTEWGPCTVEYVPCQPGDSWIFKDNKDRIFYVSEGCTIMIIPTAQPSEVPF